MERFASAAFGAGGNGGGFWKSTVSFNVLDTVRRTDRSVPGAAAAVLASVKLMLRRLIEAGIFFADCGGGAGGAPRAVKKCLRNGRCYF
jgi:hypothetical protein